MGGIWVFLVAVSVAVAAATGRMAALTTAVAESAGRAVTLALGLVGVMTLWLGLMRVAEEAGLVALLGRAARPALRRLFPEVPPEHPAMGAMVMNVAANMLGLGNAATPFGLKAMAALEEMNPHRGTATDAQALFCAINTASVQIIPASVIALRAAAGASQPGDVIGPTLLATSCALVAAVTSAKVLGRMLPKPPVPAGRPPAHAPGQGGPPAGPSSAAPPSEGTPLTPPPGGGSRA